MNVKELSGGRKQKEIIIIRIFSNAFHKVMVRFSVVLFCSAITAKLVGNVRSEVCYFVSHIFQ